MDTRLQLESLCVHGGGRDDSQHHAASMPIYQSTTYGLTPETFDAMLGGRPRECLIYTRYGNPTIWSLERHLAALEGADSAVATASGMGAIASAMLALTQPGDHIVAAAGGYGNTSLFLERVAAQAGRSVAFAADSEVESVSAQMGPHTRLVHVESLGNPTNVVADIPALAELAHARGARLLVDATFASPALQRPLQLGADLVVHSASKYLNGHGDLIAGALLGGKDLVDRAWDHMRLLGACIDPHAAFLLQRGLRTLHLRVQRVCDNAARLARFLETQPAVARVLYPALPSHPHHARARRLLPRGCGGIVGCVLHGGDEAALRFCRALRLVFEATSLGGVESLVSLPFNTSHANLAPAQRAAAGIEPGLVRLAVGIEAAEDLEADLAQALAAAATR
ncbi:MAG: aminotransferase class I/II-fold pyridoxal phosphate-dependent enzyme [Planctomycetota bacterium]|nr:MAG: aminotransferase class I/II-fold pyridoxal phosphate-dependent enzyme [Planctomycetota bacterium]